MVGGREDANRLCWDLADGQEPFYISEGFQGWLPGKDSGCCRAYAPHWVPNAPLTKEGPLPALRAEQRRDFSGGRMVHPVPLATPPRAQCKLQARALLSVGLREQVQRHFPVSPPHCPSGLCRDLEWKCALVLSHRRRRCFLSHESHAGGCICGEGAWVPYSHLQTTAGGAVQPIGQPTHRL